MASYLKAAMDYAASMGVTTAQSNDLSENNYPDFLAAIDLLRQRDAITCRYFAQCSFTCLLYTSQRDRRARLGL